MIILEGADGSGKTTAGNQLAEALGAPLIHSPGYNVNWWMSAFAHHESQPEDIVIYDRFYFSELVYGPILRGQSRVEPWFEEYAKKVWFPSIQPLVIFCHVPLEVAQETVEVEDQMEGVKPNLARIQRQYEGYFRSPDFLKHRAWLMHYDFTKKPLDIEAIKSWCEARRFKSPG